jgi:hypothetical protein
MKTTYESARSADIYSRVDAGEKSIDWLYTEQVNVDAQWSVRRDTVFTWWADKNGLLLAQFLPADDPRDAQGAKLPLDLNTIERRTYPFGYGLLSFWYRDAMIHFSLSPC